MKSIWTEWNKIVEEIGPAFAGLNLVAGVALVSRLLHGWIRGPTLNKAISEVLIAVVLGLYIRNALSVSARFEAGIKFALNRVLRLGIILLGLRLSLQDIVAMGPTAFALVVVCITVALLMAYAAGRLFNIPARLAALIGVGTAICGNSAIVATAPVIEANEDDVSFAVATITFFGLIAVIVYPLLGRLLGLSDHVFGLWAGTAVNDTSQVVAVGAAYSSFALNVATVVKLMRNTLMAPIMVFIGLVYSRAGRHRLTSQAAQATRLTFGKLVPWFVLGFLLLAFIRSGGVAAGVLPRSVDRPGQLQAAASALKFVDEIAKFCILMALAGVGLGTNVQNMRKIGLKPFVVGLCVAGVLAVVSLSLILLVRPG